MDNPSTLPGLLITQPTDSSPTSLATASLDSLLDMVVHEMTPTQLTEYVKRCAVLRGSAQTRKAALVEEGHVLGEKRKTKKKDSVAAAMALLLQIK